jgi:phosphohistidine phosphatase
MKTLFLIRHAKSSWDDTALPDKDRPLNDRGRRDAPKMGKRLAKRDVKPNLILSSPARRALTTAEIIAKKLDYKRKDIVVEDRLYSGAVHDLLNVIQKLSDKLERVMLFGHNPELTELAHRLSSEITHMPTCAIAEFMFSAKSWSNIGKAKLAKLALDYRRAKHRVSDEGDDAHFGCPTGSRCLRRRLPHPACPLRLPAYTDGWRHRRCPSCSTVCGAGPSCVSATLQLNRE